jgi:hypothetical protein
MRGQKLFKANFGTPVEKNTNKGRSTALVQQRNECLMARYFFYSKLLRRSYEEIIGNLSGEFFLCTETVTRIIFDNNHILQQLKTQENSLRAFRSKWKHMKWNI